MVAAGSAQYVPARGDLVWLNFDPQTGHEQAGRRPALVISPLRYNRATGLALFCPITSRRKGYPFEVALPKIAKINGVVIADQLRSLDWRARRVELIEPAPADLVDEVIGRFAPLIRD